MVLHVSCGATSGVCYTCNVVLPVVLHVILVCCAASVVVCDTDCGVEFYLLCSQLYWTFHALQPFV